MELPVAGLFQTPEMVDCAMFPGTTVRDLSQQHKTASPFQITYIRQKGTAQNRKGT
jgi:hypothetical protein